MTFLSPQQQHTLALICDTLVPGLDPQADEDETLFRLSASDLQIPARVEASIQRVTGPDEQRQLRWFLNALENGLTNGLIAGQWCPFSEMPLSAREKVLYGLATHPLEQARTAFLTIKRLTTYLFYAVRPTEGQPNPTWSGIGYPNPAVPDPIPRPIQPYTPEGNTVYTDILVIGSGAGGGVVAGELATAGYDVMVVEKGDYYNESDYNGSEFDGMERMYERWGTLVNKDATMQILAGTTLGGGTVVNWSASLRPPEHVLDQWAGVHGFTGATSREYTASIEAVEARSNINTEESWLNANNAKLEEGAKKLGYTVGVVPRNVKGCEDCGFCNYGCSFGAKQSTLKTYLQDAYDAGARITVRGHVERVLHRDGKVTGAQVTLQDPETDLPRVVTIHAKAVVVSAGTIHTPALLIRSGLQNPNIGMNLHMHPTTVISGLFDEPVNPWYGPPLTRTVFDMANLDGHGYGVWLETAPAHPGINGMVMGWQNGRQHKRIVQQMQYNGNIIILTRDRDSGRVTVDKNGQPVIDYRISDYDAAHLLTGLKAAVRIHAAAGAVEIATPHNDRLAYTPGANGSLVDFLGKLDKRGLKPNDYGLFSAHQMCTARIGGDPARGAISPIGESYEVENLFVADGSALPTAPGVNPMLSIMATAHYIAQNIKAQV